MAKSRDFVAVVYLSSISKKVCIIYSIMLNK